MCIRCFVVVFLSISFDTSKQLVVHQNWARLGARLLVHKMLVLCNWHTLLQFNWTWYLCFPIAPKSPALCDAPLHRGKAQSENTQPQSSTTQSSSVKPEAQSTTEPDMQSDEMQSAPELEVHPTAGDRNEQPEASDSERSSSLSEQFPVIVFSHGMAGMRTTYSAICCDLASHGYVVASVEHRDQSACLSLSRVPVGTVRDGQQQQYRDDWIPFYFLPKEEPEFPIRHKQVPIHHWTNTVSRIIGTLKKCSTFYYITWWWLY